MPRRLLSILLILALVMGGAPAALAGEMGAAQDQPRSYVHLKKGDRDGDDSSDVLVLQQAMIDLGYLRDVADGVYGANTATAVAAFQRSNGLEETGDASPEMQELLYSGAELVSAMNSTDPESAIYRVEAKMELWGFASNVPNGIVNETTGESIPAFKSYLVEYEKAHPLPEPEATENPTGYGDAAIAVDKPRDNVESSEITEQVLGYVDGEYEFEVYSRTVASGDSGAEVLRVQRRLYALNYLAVADGEFGAGTERALLYFQKKNGLEQSAVADEETQRLLFSEAALPSEEFVNAYKLVIDISEQMVYAYQWNGSNYGTCVREMICSTGKNATPTPLGAYQAAGPTGTGEWYWFSKYECYAKWATRIVGGILFHSVTYSRGKSLNRTSVSKLGSKASHGCVRLKVEDAKWVYEICVPGTTVLVQD